MDSQNQEMYFTDLLSQDNLLSQDDSPMRLDNSLMSLDYSPMSLDDSSPIPPNKCARARGANFSPEEDKLLVSAWLNCSIDAVQGTDQKYHQLWEKIFDYFQQHKETTTARTTKSLIHRWSCIQKSTNKFCAKLAQVQGLNQSGMTEQDKFEKAKIMYKSLEKSNFQFEHCWHLLRDEPKWKLHNNKNVPKHKRMMNPSPAPTSTTTQSPTQNVTGNDFIELDRPMGRKAEKRQRKTQGRQAEEINEFRKMKYTLLEESRTQEKEFYRLKAEKMEYDKANEEKRLHLEDERLRLEEEKLRLEVERMELAKKDSDERIMMMDASVMPELQRLYIEKLQKEIMMRGSHA